MTLANPQFEIGFWHPFGPHGDETAQEILVRKKREINDNGWTLWSFQHRTTSTLEAWHREIQARRPDRVWAFCSEGVGARAPGGKTTYCDYYIPLGTSALQQIPSTMKVPHPMGRDTKTASAFVVNKNIDSFGDADHDFGQIPIEWMKDGKWQTAPLPTRPEYLIKVGQGSILRRFRAILVLESPYLARVGIR
jgi:hypothetical protein